MLAALLIAQVAAALPPRPTIAAVESDPVPADKVAHAAVSYSLTLTGALLLEKLDVERWQAVAIAGGVTLLLGFAKEYLVDSEASGGDLAADGLGVGLGAGMVFTFEL
jgi:hypothetical protein